MYYDGLLQDITKGFWNKKKKISTVTNLPRRKRVGEEKGRERGNEKGREKAQRWVKERKGANIPFLQTHAILLSPVKVRSKISSGPIYPEYVRIESISSKDARKEASGHLASPVQQLLFALIILVLTWTASTCARTKNVFTERTKRCYKCGTAKNCALVINKNIPSWYINTSSKNAYWKKYI